MKYSKIMSTFLLFATCFLNAQENSSDQLYLSNGETFEVNIKKVDPETITYNFIGEDLENVVEKANVEKIIFKSGRKQQFTGIAALETAAIPDDFEYPTLKSDEGAILPFEFIIDGTVNAEEGTEAQE